MFSRLTLQLWVSGSALLCPHLRGPLTCTPIYQPLPPPTLLCLILETPASSPLLQPLNCPHNPSFTPLCWEKGATEPEGGPGGLCDPPSLRPCTRVLNLPLPTARPMLNPRLQPQPRPQPGPPSVSRGTWGSSALTLQKSRSASSVLLPGAGIVRVQSQRDDPRPRPRHRGGLPSSLPPVSLCGVEGTSFSLAASGSVTDPRSRDTPRAPAAAGPAAAAALKWSFYTVGGPRAPLPALDFW